MAYRIKQTGSEFAVYTVGGDTVPGGLHGNRAAAVRHLRTLYSRLSNEQRRNARRFRGTILQSKDTGAGAQRQPISLREMPDEGARTPSDPSTGKAEQKDAGYRIGTPPITCATCKYFNALDNSCDKVVGYISPDAVSDMYAAESYGSAGGGDYSKAAPNTSTVTDTGVLNEGKVNTGKLKEKDPKAALQDTATTDEALPQGQMDKRSGKDRRSRPRPMMSERRKGDVLKRILAKPAPVRSNDTQGTPDTGVYSENHRAYPRDYLYMGRTFSPGQRKRYSANGIAMKDGSYPIPDVDALKKAINGSDREGNPPRGHIKSRAAALGQSGLIPSAWVERDALIVQEVFCPTLRFEASDATGVTLLQEATAPGGVARIKVPFIIGNSIAKAPGFTKKLFWPAGIIDSIVNEGNKQIASATQPLTVYARHADAVDPTALPIGAVTEMSREGNVGYAILDIINEGKGAQVIALASAKPRPLINAVSLRSGAGRFDLTEEKVNGEIMHVPTRVAIDGIDMAPNSPAMATYGVQMLAAEATVEPITTITRSKQMSDLTAEALRQEDPGLVAEIEAPMRARLNELEQENSSLKQENTTFKASVAKAERDAYIIELSTKFPEPEKALPVLQEHCKDASTKDDVRAATFDVMLELLSANRAVPVVPAADPKDALRKLFVVGGAGASVTAESEPEESAKFAGKEGTDHIGDLALPSF